MQRLGLLLIWVVATVLVTVLAWRVVLAADAQISDPPVRGVEARPPTATRPSLPVPEETTTSLDLDPEAPQRPTPTTEVPPESTTTTSGSPAPETSTTVAATSSTIGYETKTIPTAGGSVTVRYRPGQVDLLTVVPAPGWQWDTEKVREDDIEGKFTKDDQSIQVRARWSDGEFVWSVGD